jgi:hypothetical protein
VNAAVVAAVVEPVGAPNRVALVTFLEAAASVRVVVERAAGARAVVVKDERAWTVHRRVTVPLVRQRSSNTGAQIGVSYAPGPNP